MRQVHFGSSSSMWRSVGNNGRSIRQQYGTTTCKSSRSTYCCCWFLVSLLTMNVLYVQAAPTFTTTTTATPTIPKTYTTNLQQPQQQQPSARVEQCREGCFEKFATKEILCQQNSECLTCYEECAKPPPPKLNKPLRDSWSLRTVSMLLQDSLVLVDVAWSPLSTLPNQCLVTWEVSGGGLMGNLLTESFNVQLSLWPETKYRVQVTCKNKLTGSMTRSLPLTIDTADAVNALDVQPEKIQKTKKPLPFALNINSMSNNKQNSVETAPRPSVNSDLINNNLAKQFEKSEENEVDEDTENIVEPGAAPLPYDDEQSSESINQHTNFIFNWHTRNSDISAIEPLHKPDLNIFNITSLSDLQKPLLFGVIAGALLLALVLLFYICILRQQRVSSDKATLIDENNESQSVAVSLPPACATRNFTSNQLELDRNALDTCRNPAICSRNALKV